LLQEPSNGLAEKSAVAQLLDCFSVVGRCAVVLSYLISLSGVEAWWQSDVFDTKVVV
jgi:hypothetical protein